MTHYWLITSPSVINLHFFSRSTVTATTTFGVEKEWNRNGGVGGSWWRRRGRGRWWGGRIRERDDWGSCREGGRKLERQRAGVCSPEKKKWESCTESCREIESCERKDWFGIRREKNEIPHKSGTKWYAT